MTINIQSLNSDVLCHLMTYLEPVDRLNLVLSGMLMDLQVEGSEEFLGKRLKFRFILLNSILTQLFIIQKSGIWNRFYIFSSSGPFNIQVSAQNRIKFKILTRILFIIRDLKVNGCYKSGRALFDRLTKSGVLRHLRHLDVKHYVTPELGLVKSICSFKHLETLYLREKTIKWQDVAQVFQHCPKLTQLTICVPPYERGVSPEPYQNQIRSGIQKLDCLILLTGESYTAFRNVGLIFG